MVTGYSRSLPARASVMAPLHGFGADGVGYSVAVNV